MVGFRERYHRHWKDQRQDIARQEYLSDRVLRTFERLFVHIMRRSFAGRILDVGCGDGSFVEACRRKGLDAEGIDIKVGCDLEKDPLPFSDRSFEIVIMSSVIEHLRDPDNVLTEIKRVLLPGGCLVIVTPEWTYVMRHFYDDPTHVHPYTHRSLRALMEMYGFSCLFVGLWTVGKSCFLWRLDPRIQFLYGSLLPFTGLNRWAPGFLKGRSQAMLACFSFDGKA